MKKKIIDMAYNLDIPLIGFTDNNCLYDLQDKINISDKLGYTSPFIKGTLEERTNPNILLENCQTIISIAIPYLRTCENLENIDEETVYFSSSSWGEDYHKVLTRKMKLLVEEIKKIYPFLEYKILVDNHHLDDRYIAYKAGIGYYGLNNLLINETFGSYIFIGNILTNLSIEKDNPQTKECMKCMKCVKECPTKAIDVNNRLINANKCLSYITQKKNLTKEEEGLFTDCIYGCDICGKVCPYNYKNNTREEFLPKGIEFINVKNSENLSNKKWMEKYGKLSGSWRGKKIINRNISICKNKKDMLK